MDEYVDFFPELALAAALLLAALAAAPLFERIRLPSPAAFLAVGIAAGLLEIAPTADLPVVRLEQVGAVALFVILFQGGLSTGFGAARAAARPILSLGLVGTAATASGWRWSLTSLLGLDWSIALLVAAALAPTDPAAVYAVLRGRSGSERARTILEGESGFNDPAAISLMVAVTAAIAAGHSSYGHAVARFAEELGIGLAAGIAGGLQNALLVHDWLMHISFFLLLGHLYLALINPSTRHSLSGMTRGWAREDWALRHHRKWAEQVREEATPRSRAEARALRPRPANGPDLSFLCAPHGGAVDRSADGEQAKRCEQG